MLLQCEAAAAIAEVRGAHHLLIMLRNEPGRVGVETINEHNEQSPSESISRNSSISAKSDKGVAKSVLPMIGQVPLGSQAMTAKQAARMRRHIRRVPNSTTTLIQSSAPTIIKTNEPTEAATATTIGRRQSQSSHSSKQLNVITKLDSLNERSQHYQGRAIILFALILIQITLQLGLPFSWSVGAVSVQRLAVPDLVVIDQTTGAGQSSNQASRGAGGGLPLRTTTTTTVATGGASSAAADIGDLRHNYQQAASSLSPSQAAIRLSSGAGGNQATTAAAAGFNQPEAASLITRDPANGGGAGLDQVAAQNQMQAQQITFECLVSYDKRRDKNLIVKWHHDERNEPIYQWIPELNKRSIAPQYRPYIVPIIGANTSTSTSDSISASSGQLSDLVAGQNKSQPVLSLLQAGFKLYRPTKELGGKYTCSAISSQNDDSKSKKMIVYTPPRSFSFNASRANIGQLFASQRDRLIRLSQPTLQQQQQLPLAYRMRGIEPLVPLSTIGHSPGTTISPQMLSTIDYVNVNQQRARLQSAAASGSVHGNYPGQALQHLAPNWPNRTHSDSQQQWTAATAATATTTTTTSSSGSNNSNRQQQQQYGIKLVCDIDQVFPVPEVSIYRLAKLDGSHPEKLAKLDTRIERDVHTGLFHVQVTSVLDADELQLALARQQQQQQQVGGQNDSSSGPEIYFECLIALTNLELSRYADNRRSIIYRPGTLAASGGQQELQTSENMNQPERTVGSGSSRRQPSMLFKWHAITSIFAFHWLLGLSLLATLGTSRPQIVDLH